MAKLVSSPDRCSWVSEVELIKNILPLYTMTSHMIVQFWNCSASPTTWNWQNHIKTELYAQETTKIHMKICSKRILSFTRHHWKHQQHKFESSKTAQYYSILTVPKYNLKVSMYLKNLRLVLFSQWRILPSTQVSHLKASWPHLRFLTKSFETTQNHFPLIWWQQIRSS